MPRCSACLATILALCASALGAADLDAVKARGALRVLVVSIKGPDEFFPLEGPVPGFDREVLDGFAKLERLRLEPVPIESWDDLVPALVADKGDVVAGRFTVTAERSKRIAFTTEVFPTRNVVLTRKPTPPVTTLDELRALRVGTVRGSSMAEAVAKAGVPRANVDDSVAPGALPAALAAGKVEAVVLGVENAIVVQHKNPGVELGMFVGPPGSLAYGVRKEDAALRSALDQYIENLRRTATWNRLVVKYFGESAPEILKRARTE